MGSNLFFTHFCVKNRFDPLFLFRQRVRTGKTMWDG